MPDFRWTFLDPREFPNDPLNGRMVLARGVRIFGKATVEDYRGGRHTVFMEQELQVRDAPLFSHAIFYNMDMEIAPGPRMDVWGPVHANGDMYIQSGGGLAFHMGVTSAGQMFHGPKNGFGKGTDNAGVWFVDRDANLVSMQQGGSWLDSLDSDWRDESSNLWHGNVQSEEHGVPVHNPVSIDDYVADDIATVTDETENHGYRLIQPVNSTRPSEVSDIEVEKQKFAYKAGLTIEVDTSSGSATLYAYERDLYGDIVYDGSTPGAYPSATPESWRWRTSPRTR
ncbi:MAG: hypothetical protein HC841_04290 [Verrucomicrobiae bacterium]|nr:hypothetical protein [Verrucomicrobiae bacterium]